MIKWCTIATTTQVRCELTNRILIKQHKTYFTKQQSYETFSINNPVCPRGATKQRRKNVLPILDRVRKVNTNGVCARWFTDAVAGANLSRCVRSITTKENKSARKGFVLWRINGHYVYTHCSCSLVSTAVDSNAVFTVVPTWFHLNAFTAANAPR